MGDQPIRTGIVGATVTTGGSGWGAGAHVPALRALPEFELLAVCTSRDETARASAETFGAALAFTDVHKMASHPDVDLVVVSVRVPWHRDLVMAGLAAGKPVFCEWPLGASLTEAEEMASTAREAGLPTAVGLQGRGDAHLRHARDLIADGFVGRVVVANLVTSGPAIVRRGAGRIWQADRAAGANPLTIQGGHSIDALCFLVGEFVEVSARLATTYREWHDLDTGETVTVTAPDVVGLAGQVAGGAEVVVQVSTVPAPIGFSLEVHGTEGVLRLSGQTAHIGPNKLAGSRAGQPLEPITPPVSYQHAPAEIPDGIARNVAESYTRLADALRAGTPFDPDFDHAVRRHRLIAAIERSAAESRSVTIA